MPLPHIITYCSEHLEGVKALWSEAFPDDPPWNAANLTIPAKLAFQPDLFFVSLDRDKVIDSIMAGYDGHRGWLYALAVLNSHQRQGIGAALVREAENRLQSLGCRKINLQVRSSNAAVVEFYHHIGYATEERISMSKRLPTSA
jgi:ribosomal protein S18 acetylase RimI-like enzyme